MATKQNPNRSTGPKTPKGKGRSRHQPPATSHRLSCTGPKTPAGKAVSSMNALRTGLYACTVLLPGENRAEFDQLHDGIQSFYAPANPSEQKLVDEMAALEWKIWRVELIEAGVLLELGDAPATACVQPYDRVTQVQCRPAAPGIRSWTVWMPSARPPKPEKEQHPSPSTQHPAPNTQHPAPITQHPSPSTQHPSPSTRSRVPRHSLESKLDI